MFAAIVGQSWATAAHPYNLEVNGIDWINAASFPTIDIEMPGPGSNGSMTFTLSDPTSAIDVAEWDEVRFIEHAATRPILFGGFVQSVRYVAWAVNGRDVIVECMGYGILLDRKVVPSFVIAPRFPTLFVSETMVTLINRHGGRLSALATADYGGSSTLQTDAVYSIAFNQWWDIGAAGEINLASPMTLRAAVDGVLRTARLLDNDTKWLPAGGTYWVDSAARFCVLFDPSSTNINAPDQRFADTVPGIQITTTGSYRVGEISWEIEDTDHLTTIYVDGANPAGSGYYSVAALERAGDLEAIVTDSSSTSASAVLDLGRAAIGRVAAATGRGEIELFSSTPLDIWPGRHIDVAFPQLGLDATQDFRITAVRVSFQSSTDRVYHVNFGGSLPAPSAMRRIGRFAIRPF